MTPNQASYWNSGSPAPRRSAHRQAGEPLGAGDGEPAHLAALDEVAAHIEEREGHGHVAADDGGLGFRQAAEGEVDDIGLRRLLEQLAAMPVVLPRPAEL
jgi:hypothetical protein